MRFIRYVMRYVYLLADCQLDRLFGFVLEQVQIMIPIGVSGQEFHITDIIKNVYKYEPTVRDVLVVVNNEGKGLVGKINVHSRKKIFTNDAYPGINSDIRLEGDYLDELKNYLIEENEADRIVIAYSEISPAVKRDMERLVGDLYLRAEIFPSHLTK